MRPPATSSTIIAELEHELRLSKKKIKQLEADLKREQECVDFYAKGSNWDSSGLCFEPVINDDRVKIQDCGDIARETQQQRRK